MKTTFKILLLSLFIILANGCEYETQIHQIPLKATIDLYNQPLYVIQQYITGDWKLQYTEGGLAWRKYTDTINSYVDFTPYHIIAGNDVSGVYIDANIKWSAWTDHGEKTYLYSYSGNSMYFQVVQMKNDTLIIRDYTDDGFYYYYVKYKIEN